MECGEDREAAEELGNQSVGCKIRGSEAFQGLGIRCEIGGRLIGGRCGKWGTEADRLDMSAGSRIRGQNEALPLCRDAS